MRECIHRSRQNLRRGKCADVIHLLTSTHELTFSTKIDPARKSRAASPAWLLGALLKTGDPQVMGAHNVGSMASDGHLNGDAAVAKPICTCFIHHGESLGTAAAAFRSWLLGLSNPPTHVQFRFLFLGLLN